MTFAYLNYNSTVKFPAHRTAVFLLLTAPRNPPAASTFGSIRSRAALPGTTLHPLLHLKPLRKGIDGGGYIVSDVLTRMSLMGECRE